MAHKVTTLPSSILCIEKLVKAANAATSPAATMAGCDISQYLFFTLQTLKLENGDIN